jgi:hypothetical protein
VTARRAPRASSLEVVVSSGERVRLAGRLAEVLAYVAAEVACRPALATKEFWRLEVDVSQGKVLCRFTDTAEPWRFRTGDTV